MMCLDLNGANVRKYKIYLHRVWFCAIPLFVLNWCRRVVVVFEAQVDKYPFWWWFNRATQTNISKLEWALRTTTENRIESKQTVLHKNNQIFFWYSRGEQALYNNLQIHWSINNDNIIWKKMTMIAVRDGINIGLVLMGPIEWEMMLTHI